MQALVVDDSAAVRRMVCDTLAGAGFGCDQAENGLEAIRLVLRNPYALIVTDINMPGLDGLKFVQRIRASEKGREVPVLVLTSERDQDSVLRARHLGVQGFVLKPVTPEGLLDRVQVALARFPG